MMADGMSPQEYDPLDRLFADRVLGPATKLAFYVLWRRADHRVNEIVVTATWLGDQLGRDRKTADFWLKNLEDADLIEIRDRDRRRGTYLINVLNPCPGNREPMPDPQTCLPLTNIEMANQQETARTAECDGRPTPPPRSAPPAQAGFGAEVFNSVPDSSPPCAGVSGAKLPRPFGTKEKQEYKLPNSQSNQSIQRTNEFIGPTDGPGVSDGRLPRDSAAGVHDTKLPRGISSAGHMPRPRTSRPENSMGGTACVAEIAGAALRASDPARQRSRLMGRIQAVCREPVAEWVLGSAANLVVFHGVPIEDMDRILADIQAMRSTGGLRNAGAFFHAKVRKLALQHSAPWPRKSQAANESESDRLPPGSGREMLREAFGEARSS